MVPSPESLLAILPGWTCVESPARYTMVERVATNSNRVQLVVTDDEVVVAVRRALPVTEEQRAQGLVALDERTTVFYPRVSRVNKTLAESIREALAEHLSAATAACTALQEVVATTGLS